MTDLVQEGLYLYRHDVSAYDGGIFHQVGSTASLSKAVTDETVGSTSATNFLSTTGVPQLPPGHGSSLHLPRPGQRQCTHGNRRIWRGIFVETIYLPEEGLSMD